MAKAVYNCKKSKHMMKPCRQDKQKYFFLLRELILNKQDSEYETSIEDKFDDLKKDLVNEMRKMLSDLEKRLNSSPEHDYYLLSDWMYSSISGAKQIH